MWCMGLEGYELGKDNILRRTCNLPDGSVVKEICIPSSLHHIVCEELHEKMGHFGVG